MAKKLSKLAMEFLGGAQLEVHCLLFTPSKLDFKLLSGAEFLQDPGKFHFSNLQDSP